MNPTINIGDHWAEVTPSGMLVIHLRERRDVVFRHLNGVQHTWGRAHLVETGEVITISKEDAIKLGVLIAFGHP